MRRAILTATLVAAACGGRRDSGIDRADGPPATTRLETSTTEHEWEIRPTRESVFQRIDAPVERAWEALPSMYADLGMPGGVLDSRRMLFGALRFRPPRRMGDQRLSALIDCGSGAAGPNAEFYEVTLTVRTLLLPEAGGTSIETRVHGTARPREVSGQTMTCTSNGRLEGMIAQALGTRAGR